MLYYTYPTSQRVIIERPSSLQSTLTLDDYLQLQLLLRHEQRRRCDKREQQYRVTQALHNLKVLKEHYRRERAQRIQRLMDHYRRTAMIAAAQQDAVYRQWLASALEQRRSEEIWRQYQAACQNEQQSMQEKMLQQQNEDEQATKEESDNESEAEEDKGFEDFHANQLARILKLLFGQQEQEDTMQQQVDEAESAASEEDEESQAHDLWNYISKLQQQQQQDNDYTEQVSDEEQEQPMDEEQEKPMSASSAVATEPAQEPKETVMQDKKVPSTTQKAIASEPEDKYEDILKNWPKQQQEKEREPVSITRENAPIPQATSTTQQQRQYAPSPDPPLQDRVLNLKDLLDELVNTEQQVPEACQEEQEQTPAYAPKQVVTPAEPATSNVQNDDPPPRQLDPSNAPAMSPDPTAAQRVHEIAEQQKRNLPPSEPVIQHPELLQIQRELENMEHDRLHTVLKAPLQFKASEPGGTLQLTATTPNNREFLGCEDAIMRIMIKLDTIESHGQEKVRNQRRSLVKRAEGMLEKLDEHKEHEWQRARKLSTLKNTTSNKKKHHKQRHRRHHPKHPVTVG
ncbi:hypothetical protein K492DRAFT_177813 [Lichtheimia hyalospora FSU 10163]|nr:hypothetical protein K492DRAFT_177813 [Lichtheimia hyalospora FSU 10163]